MDKPRVRLGTLVEWLAAAVVLLGVLALSSTLLRDVRAAGVMPLSAGGPGAAVATAAVPSRAVSVPVLLLSAETSVRLGDTATAVGARLGAQAESGPVSAEQAEDGDRLTRVYDVQGTRFALVFQQLANDPEPRVSAIYLLP